MSKKYCEGKHFDLLLIGKGEKHSIFLSIISLNSCIAEENIFYCLHAFITEEILKIHITDCFKINGKQTIKMPKKGKYVKLKDFKRKIKSLFMIYADFESILVPEDNGKQNPNESYTNKYEKYVDHSYGYKLVFVDDKFSKPFQSYLGGKDAVYFIIV